MKTAKRRIESLVSFYEDFERGEKLYISERKGKRGGTRVESVDGDNRTLKIEQLQSR